MRLKGEFFLCHWKESTRKWKEPIGYLSSRLEQQVSCMCDMEHSAHATEKVPKILTAENTNSRGKKYGGERVRPSFSTDELILHFLIQ